MDRMVFIRRYWATCVDALERHLDRLNQVTQAKSKTRERRRGADRKPDTHRKPDKGGAK
jgi:hypothetical protein